MSPLQLRALTDAELARLKTEARYGIESAESGRDWWPRQALKLISEIERLRKRAPSDELYTQDVESEVKQLRAALRALFEAAEIYYQAGTSGHRFQSALDNAEIALNRE